MRGLCYQLKSVLHDKFCLMTFLLPIIVAAALHFSGRIDMSSLGELQFGILEEELPEEDVAWLEQYGTVTVYGTTEELRDGINEPSTNMIGVTADGEGIQTMVSGDELELFRQTADTLPALYEQRDMAAQKKIRIIERTNVMAGFQDLLFTVTLIVAMFMGCTFNAMNIISEKEDGVALVNGILPMTRSGYMVQKMTVGFVCGCLSSFVTSCICFRLSLQKAGLMLVLILLSAFVSALFGVLIGKFSDGLMVGVVYIKIVMLLFLAVPILCFLVGSGNSFLTAVCYLVPSQAAFEGIMDLAAGNHALAGKDILILAGHCVGWTLVCLAGEGWHRKRS